MTWRLRRSLRTAYNASRLSGPRGHRTFSVVSASSTRGIGGRSLAGPPRPAARPKPPFSSASTLPSPLLLPSQFPLLAQSHLEKHEEHSCAKTEGDQRDGEHFAGQPADQDRADRTRDNERRGRSKCQDARAGRHRPKVSLRPAAEQITVAGNESAASRAPHPPAMRSAGGRAILSA
jgi:hypothetical protein